VITPSEPGRWSLEEDGYSIAQLRLPAPHLFIQEASVYLFSAGDEHLLVDAGPHQEPSWPSLVEQLAERGVRPADIGTVLVTHAHPDHYGSAPRFQAVGARVLIHRLDLAFHEQRNGDPAGYRERLFDWLGTQGVPLEERRAWVETRTKSMSSIELRPDQLLDGGEEIPIGPLRLRVEWTPGHTPGHVIAWEPRHNLVLLGDHVLPTASPNIGIDQDFPGNPLPGYLESLRRLGSIPDLVALPGHGHRFDIAARSRELLAHQEDRGRRVVHAVAAGARTAYDVRPFAWDDPTWAGLSRGLRINAIRTLAAHLARLEEMGLVARRTEAGLDVYAPAGPASAMALDQELPSSAEPPERAPADHD
jgi:glyoxylase-like metal-dependent hydrolase (beta-lactamase superfamily II)